MRYFDISVPIHGAMPVYEGDPPVGIELSHSIAKGDPYNVSWLRMSAHTGTHVDAPRHFFDGAATVDEIPIDVLIGPALVLDVGEAEEISSDIVSRGDLEGHERVLFKTSNSALWNKDGFRKDFVHIAPDAARYLVEIGIRLVGIDYLSIEKFGAEEAGSHKTLLGANVVILEGLNLSGIQPGAYELICLPLPVRGCDGAPCRTILAIR